MNKHEGARPGESASDPHGPGAAAAMPARTGDGLSWAVMEPIVQVMPCAVVVTDYESASVVAMNRHAADMFAVQEHPVTGTDVHSLWAHPDQRDGMIRELLAQCRLNDREVEMRRQDGRVFWALVSLDFIELDIGKVTLMAVKDIDERTRLLQQVRASEERFRLLADNVHDVVWTMDLQGRFTYVSPSIERMRGLPASEVEGTTFWDALTPESAAWVDQTLLTRPNVSVSNLLLEQRCSDGSTIWTESNATPLRDEAGQVTGYVGTTRDVDARKQAEDALRDLNAHFALALEVTGSASFEYDPVQRTMVSTQGLERLLGRPGEEMPLDRDGIIALLHPDDVAALQPLLDGHETQEGAVFRTHFRFIAGNGKYRWMEFLGCVVRASGARGAVRLVGLCHDITERRRMEDERQQELRLESTGLLAAGMAHDFNNILTVIMGRAEQARLRAGSLPAIGIHMQEIMAACRRAGTQLSQLLAYAGQAVVRRPAVLDPVEVFAELLPQVRALTPPTVHYRPMVGAPPPPPIEGDRTMLTQLFLNVITNALEAVEPGGHVTVEMRGVTLERALHLASIRPLPPGGYLKVTVVDDGPGMEDEVLARVFDPFFTTRFLGRGLGLPAARGIVRTHQGDLKIESAPGEGTTVTILLPAAAPQPR